MGSKTHRYGGHTPHSNIPERLGLHWNLGLDKEAVFNFKAAILKHLEEKLSLAIQDYEILRRVE